MSKIEYDNFPKFIVSIGLIWIALPVILVAFVLRENSILLIHIEELSQLTDIAQQAIRQEQQIYFWIAEYIVLISVVSFCVGVGLLVVGCKRWSKYQGKLDAKHVKRQYVRIIRLFTAKFQDAIEWWKKRLFHV